MEIEMVSQLGSRGWQRGLTVQVAFEAVRVGLDL